MTPSDESCSGAEGAEGAQADPPEVIARVREHLDLVRLLSAQLQRELRVPITREELASYGHEGLLRAARSFDASRGVPFGAWATLRIRGAILDGLRSWGPLPRRVYRKLRDLQAADDVEEVLLEEDAARAPSTPEEADARLQRYLADMSTAMAIGIAGITKDSEQADGELASTPEERMMMEELALAIRGAVGELPDEERKLLERHYWGDLTIDEAAREQGLSKSWGSRLHARAVERVTRALRRSRALP